MLFNFIKARYGGKKAFLRYSMHGLQNALFGRYKKFSKLPTQINRVVFVCKGNICRSALAEWVFKSISDIPCCSLGVDTTSGVEANERISVLARGIGFDLSEHKTTAINDFIADKDDVYICMEPAHIPDIKTKLQTNRVFLLGLLESSFNVYIHDPYAACDEYASYCVEKVAKLSSVLAAEAK